MSYPQISDVKKFMQKSFLSKKKGISQYFVLQFPDSSKRSEPTLKLHSRAASSIGGRSPFPRYQPWKQFRRRVDKKIKLVLSTLSTKRDRERMHLFWVFLSLFHTVESKKVPMENESNISFGQRYILCPSSDQVSHFKITPKYKK